MSSIPNLAGKTLLIASGNKGKVIEISELLKPYQIDVVSALVYQLTEPEETADNFIENARIKALYYSQQTGLPALADDSGLCVDLLDGQPGIYSARWAGADKDFNVAMKRIEQELKEKGHHTSPARFVCALCIYFPTGEEIAVEGEVKGNLTFPARGDKGFGYDPIFIPEGYDHTFAEMDAAQKENISHRSDAFRQLIALFGL